MSIAMMLVLATMVAGLISGLGIFTPNAIRFSIKNQTGRWLVAPFYFALALTLQFPLLATSAYGQAASSDPQRQSLGSLHAVGDVFVNESRVPSELTIFAGDTSRTSDTGTAILTSGNNSFQISGRSQVVFTGDPHYFAELKEGTISVKSLGGASGAVVRIGNLVVVPTNRNEQTSSTIEKMADGSFLVTCSTGNIGVVPMQEASGIFLQAGQSARISPTGELVAQKAPAPAAAPQSAGRSRRTWIYLGLAGGAIAGGTAAAIATSGDHAPISPSAP